jgi:hypothetical protein
MIGFLAQKTTRRPIAMRLLRGADACVEGGLPAFESPRKAEVHATPN